MAAKSSAQSGFWSVPATWTGGVIPLDTDSVTVSAGHKVILDRIDLSSATVTGLAGLTINGILLVPGGDNQLKKYVKMNADITGTGQLFIGGRMPKNLLTKNQSDFEAGLTTGLVNNTGTSITSSGPYSGTYSYQSSAIGRWGIVYSTSSPVPVIPGKSYTVSMSMKSPTASAKIRISIYWLKSDYSACSPANTTGNELSVTSSWARMETTLSAPADGYYANITVYNTSTGAADYYTDQVQFEQSATATAWEPGQQTSRNLLTKNQSDIEDVYGIDIYASTGTSRITTDSHSGTACVYGSAIAAAGYIYVSTPTTSLIPTTAANTAHTISCWIKSPTVGAKIYLRLRWYDAAFGQLTDSVSSLLALTGVNTWERKTFTVTSPATAAYCRVLISNGSGLTADFYVDDVQLEAGSVATDWEPGTVAIDPVHMRKTGINLLTANQSNFETGTTGYTISNRVNTAGAYEGTWYCNHLTISDGEGFLLSNVPYSPPVIPGVNYTISAYLKSPTLNAKAAFKILFYDAAQVDLGGSIFSADTAITSSWSQKSFTFTPPVNTRYVRFSIINKTGTAADMAADALMIEQASSASAWEVGTQGLYEPGFNLEFTANMSINSADLSVYTYGVQRELFEEIATRESNTIITIPTTKFSESSPLYPGDMITLSSSFAVGNTATRHMVGQYDAATGRIWLNVTNAADPLTTMALATNGLSATTSRTDGTIGTLASPKGGTSGMVDAVVLCSRPISVFQKVAIGSANATAAFKSCKPTAFIMRGVRVYGKNQTVSSALPSDNTALDGGPYYCVFQNGAALGSNSTIRPNINYCILDRASATANTAYPIALNNSIIIGVAGGYGINLQVFTARNCRVYNADYGVCYGGQAVITDSSIYNVYVSSNSGYYAKNCSFIRCYGYYTVDRYSSYDNCTFSGGYTNYITSNTGNYLFKNCLFTGTGSSVITVPAIIPITASSELNQSSSYIESIDHQKLPGAYASWTRGGYCEKDTITGAPGQQCSYKISCPVAGAGYYAFYQEKYTLDAGETISIRAHLNSLVGWSPAPSIVMIAENADPLLDSSYSYLHQPDGTDAVFRPTATNIWQSGTLTYKNTTTLPMTIIVRAQAMRSGSNQDFYAFFERIKANVPLIGEGGFIG